MFGYLALTHEKVLFWSIVLTRTESLVRIYPGSTGV